MDRLVLLVFLTEIERQCTFALIAAGDMSHLLAPRQSSAPADWMDRFWYSVQGLLVAAGNVSKILFPREGKYASHGQALREQLTVADDSPIASRSMRNHYEHFSDRVHKWVSSSKRMNFVDCNIAPPDAIGGIDSNDYLRNYDPLGHVVSFKGESLDVQALVGCLADIRRKAGTERERAMTGIVSQG